MLAPLETLAHLQTRIAESAKRVPWRSPAGLASLVLEMPGPPDGLPDPGGPLFHLEHAHRRDLRMGFGRSALWREEGPDALARLRQRARDLLPRWWRLDPDDTGFEVFAWCGFGAEAGGPGGGGPAVLWVPEIALHCRGGQCALLLTVELPADRATTLDRWDALLRRLVPTWTLPGPGPLTPAPLRRVADQPDLASWRNLVTEALAAIAARQLDKVVAVRRQRLSAERPLDSGRLAAALGYLFPSCQVMRWRFGRTARVAATPERLLSLAGRQLEVDALAGTCARAADAAQDARLGAALLASAKDRHEHAIVVDDIRTVLGPLAANLVVPPEPRLLQLTNAQHLWSPIRATLSRPHDLLDLAARLHPTPAVSGAPRAAARDWLGARAAFARGWYTGAAGWIGPDLDGELWVLLRYAELRGREALVYAGAGLVPGSEPDGEWRETGHKLDAMLTALQFA